MNAHHEKTLARTNPPRTQRTGSRSRQTCTLILATLAALWASPALAQATAQPQENPARPAQQALSGIDMASLIQRALDQTVDFEVQDKTLRETLQVVAAESGIDITVANQTLDWLPYGPSTRVQGAAMKNATLRQGLTRLLSPLALTFESEGDHLKIVPTQALKRIGRRATWTELETLGRLTSTKWSDDNSNTGALNALADRLQFRVSADNPREQLLDRIRQIGPGRADEVLTVACDHFGWTWYPWGENIAIVEKEDQVLRGLDRTINLDVRGERLADVFIAIGAQIDIPIKWSPGVLLSVPPQARRITFKCADVSARQGLDAIAGLTGLTFEPEGDAVRILYAGPDGSSSGSGSELTTEPAGSLDAFDPVVGRIVLPAEGGAFEYEFLIRESDLPDSVKHLREQALREAVEAAQHSTADQPSPK